MTLPPKEYTMAVERRKTKTHRFNENDIKSFVYNVFALYDKHPEDVNQFLTFLADQNLEMRFPDRTVNSHADFRNFYTWVKNNIDTNLHRLERIDVEFLEKGKYKVDLIVLWQAEPTRGGFEETRFHQVWMLDSSSQRRWPRILSYVVEAAPSRDIWERYVNLPKDRQFPEWGDLWTDDSLFVVQYGRDPDRAPEKHRGRQKIVSFISGKSEEISEIDFSDSVVHQTIIPNVFFVTFEFYAKTKRGHLYQNRIVAEVTLDQGKIEKIIEYADPRRREDFLTSLAD